jgi:putative oxidoreductase
MKQWSLFLLRLSIGLLVFWWGLDKITDVEHALAVSDSFYLGILSQPWLMPILGAVQMLVAAAYVLGFQRRWVDWVVTLINSGSMLGVWKSVVDPFGHVLEGTNALFFPSLTVFAGCLVLIAFHGEERLVLDRRGHA